MPANRHERHQRLAFEKENKYYFGYTNPQET